MNHLFSRKNGFIRAFLSTGLLWSKSTALVLLITKTDPQLPAAFRRSSKPLSKAFKALLDLVPADFLALVLPLFYTDSGLQAP